MSPLGCLGCCLLASERQKLSGERGEPALKDVSDLILARTPRSEKQIMHHG